MRGAAGTQNLSRKLAAAATVFSAKIPGTSGRGEAASFSSYLFAAENFHESKILFIR